MPLTFTLHTPPSAALEAEALAPDRLAGLSAAQLAALPVQHGNQPATLGDFFNIAGDGADEVHVQGDLARVKRLGEGMRSGRLTIHGSAGAHTGAQMMGGELLVEGDVGAWAGAEMTGGRLVVRGQAGRALGSAYPGSRKGMTGGEIIVHGGAGAEVGNGLRRGLIAIGGDCGDYAGVNMLAGTIIVLGQVGVRAGAAMRRGTLVTLQPATLLPTFTFDCLYRPTFLRLYLAQLRAVGLPVPARAATGRYQRWSGDQVDLGRGEILMLEAA